MSKPESIREEDYLNYLIELARVLIGPASELVVSALSERQECTEEWLIKRTGLKLSVIRKILYELFDTGLVRYRRERDPKTGWYMYYWRLDPESIASMILRRKKAVLEKLKMRLEYEKNNTFFACKIHTNQRYTFDEAFERDFKCSECGEVLEQVDNNYIIKFIEHLIKKIENETKIKRVLIGDP